MIIDAPPIFNKVQRKKQHKARWSPMIVNYNRNPTTTTTTPKKTTTLMTKASWENYNQFSLLEDADDEEDDEGYEEIMVVTEAATSTSWTKVSAIVWIRGLWNMFSRSTGFQACAWKNLPDRERARSTSPRQVRRSPTWGRRP
eukprot:11890403-Heterocapsa_arctica.AAC.1